MASGTYIHVFKKHCAKIIDRIAHNAGVGPVSQKLKEKNIISSEVASEVMSRRDFTSHDQARQLMQAVEARIRTDSTPNKPFDDLVEILQKEASTEDLAKVLAEDLATSHESADAPNNVGGGETRLPYSEKSDSGLPKGSTSDDGSIDSAPTICGKLFRPKTTLVSDSAEDMESLSSSLDPSYVSLACGCGNCHIHTMCTKGCPQPKRWEKQPLIIRARVQLPLFSGSTMELSLEDRFRFESELKSRTFKISGAYARLVYRTCDSMSQRSTVTVRNVQLWLMNLQSMKKCNSGSPPMFLSDRKDEIVKVDNMTSLFLIMSEYWSWWNHTLLKLFIDTFGGDVEKRELLEFEKQFTTYCEHRVKFCKDIKFGVGAGKGLVPLLLKVDQNWDEIHISQLSAIQESVSSILEGEYHAFYLTSASQGCVCLEFMIPTSLAEAVFPLSLSKKLALEEAEVMKLECGKYKYRFFPATGFHKSEASSLIDVIGPSDLEVGDASAGQSYHVPSDTSYFGDCESEDSELDTKYKEHRRRLRREMDASKSRPGKATGWIATRVLDSAALTTLAAHQAVYEMALEEGKVKYRSIIGLLNGAAGSGKTTLKQLLFGMLPPELQQSTPLAEAPIRAISYVRVDATDVEWHVIDDEGQDRLIAGEMAAGVPPDDTPPSEPTPEPGSDESETTGSIDTPEASTATPFQDTRPNLPPRPMEQESSEFPPPTTQTEHLSISAAQPTLAVEDKLVSLIATTSSQQGTRREAVDLIYLIDSGGQPQFQSILRLLHGEPTTMIFVTKLSERLDHHPQIAFYEQGKPVSQLYPSLLSHEEILKCSVQALQSRVHTEGESQSATPSLVIVGSHRDREWRCFETRADKNKRLISLLSPAIQKHLVYYGDDLIFPVNAKNPGKQDRKVASEIRKAILRAASSVEPEKTPLGWYVLDVALHRLASSLRRGILTRQECLQMAYRLHISEEGFEAALDHLSKLNVILYFRSVLPNLVFCSPQVLLDKLSELVQYNYQLRTSQTAITDRILMFRDKGLVTLEFLQEFPKHYDSNFFTPTDLLQLLDHRLIIAQVEEGMYFMPFILPDLPPDQVDHHRVQPSSPAAALVVLFPGGVAPTGSFSALVASLLSTQHPPHWELLPSSTNPGRPECVFRNCIKFKLPNGAPGSLTLVDSFSFFEAHVHTPIQVASSICFSIRDSILQHLRAAADALQYKQLRLEIAFLCEDHPHPHLSLWEWFTSRQTVLTHPATLSDVGETRWWRCTLTPDKVYGELKERHLIWLNPTSTIADVNDALTRTDGEANTTEAGEVNSGDPAQTSSPVVVTPECVDDTCLDHKSLVDVKTQLITITEWLNLGLVLGLHQPTLIKIKINEQNQVNSCMADMIMDWLNQKDSVGTPSWQSLTRALMHPLVNKTDIAASIAATYPKK